jgi:hypothetical protein
MAAGVGVGVGVGVRRVVRDGTVVVIYSLTTMPPEATSR